MSIRYGYGNATLCIATLAARFQNAKCPAMAGHFIQSPEPAIRILDGGEVAGRALASALVGHDLKLDLLALLERAESSTFNGGDVDENVLVAILRLNEAVALLLVEPLDGTGIH